MAGRGWGDGMAQGGWGERKQNVLAKPLLVVSNGNH